MLIASFSSSVSKFLNMKAPKGLAFEITSIGMSIDSYEETATLRRAVLTIVPFEITQQSQDPGLGRISYYLPANSTAATGVWNHQIVDINHETKYFAINLFIDPVLAVSIFVYGKYVKLSEIDEIWEFITKAVI